MDPLNISQGCLQRLKIYAFCGAVANSVQKHDNKLNEKREGIMAAMFLLHFVHEDRSNFGTTRSHNLLTNEL